MVKAQILMAREQLPGGVLTSHCFWPSLCRNACAEDVSASGMLI